MSQSTPRQAPLRGKALATAFFKKTADANIWICRCGVKRTSQAGYSNLTSHVLRDHPEEAQKLQSGGLDHSIADCFYSKKVRDSYGWLALVVDALLPFSTCENPAYRSIARVGPISRKTFMEVMLAVVDVVEKKIASDLPDRFALVFDGWTAASTHFLAVFATFPGTSEYGWSRVLLGFSPMGDEESLGATDHLEYCDFVLNVFGKSRRNVVALIGDNCSVNKAFARRFGISFIGCASHRFNLALVEFLEDYSEIVGSVTSLMKTLRNLIPSARLRKLTPLHPRLAVPTR